MSEKIVIARRDLTCDVCGQRIPAGTKCRIVHDDFLPILTYFEHIQCPGASAVAVSEPPPKPPKLRTFNHAFCMA